MKIREIRLNKAQFKLFNDDDQFNIFNADGYSEYEDFNEELDKLFKKFDQIIVTEKEQIIGEKNGEREILHPDAFESYGIALEIQQDFN